MNEIIFLIEDSPDGGFIARALNYSIFTEAENFFNLKQNIKDAVKCHFEEVELPKVVRLHYVRDEVFALA